MSSNKMVDDKDPSVPQGQPNTPDKAKLARERHEAEQRRRLDELRAHAAAAQAQRERIEEERRQRQAENRARDEERRQQVEERKRALWEATESRREALLQRERQRAERLERARSSRHHTQTSFAFGSSVPRLLEAVATSGFLYSARSTNPIDQMDYHQSISTASSTNNVMAASAPLVRPASSINLTSDDNKDDADSRQNAHMWSSVARRRTDLVPTLPLPRAPGRAYSMTRLDRIPSQRPLHSASPSMHHLNRTHSRSGETSPGSRPDSAMSNASRAARRPRTLRPTTIASSVVSTGVSSPAGGDASGSASADATETVSRDSTMAGGDVMHVPCPQLPGRRRIVSRRVKPPAPIANVPDSKPPVPRKPSQDVIRSKKLERVPSHRRGQSVATNLGASSSSDTSKEASLDKDLKKESKITSNEVSATEVSQKLEALHLKKINDEPSRPTGQQIEEDTETEPQAKATPKTNDPEKPTETTKSEESKSPETLKAQIAKPPETPQTIVAKPHSSHEKIEENEMTASMTARRITTEEEAKAALAERRRRAREWLEKEAEQEKIRLIREAEEEAEKQRQEEERQRREEDEARELSQLQLRMEEEKLRKAIEAQQQLEREEAERKAREELERQARLKDEDDKRRAAEEAERLRREEAEREEKERSARKQRVEAIMARTRKKAEEQKNQESKSPASAPAPIAQSSPQGADNGNLISADATASQLLLNFSQIDDSEDQLLANRPTLNNSPNANAPAMMPNNVPSLETNNGNVQTTNNIHISANFIDSEKKAAEQNEQKSTNGPKQVADRSSHNGYEYGRLNHTN